MFLDGPISYCLFWWRLDGMEKVLSWIEILYLFLFLIMLSLLLLRETWALCLLPVLLVFLVPALYTTPKILASRVPVGRCICHRHLLWFSLRGLTNRSADILWTMGLANMDLIASSITQRKELHSQLLPSLAFPWDL